MPARRSSVATAEGRQVMARVFIGVDPHKLSATIEVVDDHETVLATGRFGTDKAGYAAMRNTSPGIPTGLGRWRAATAPAARWRSGCWPTASTWWMCRRSCPPGLGRWIPGTTARPTHDAHAVAVVAVRTPTLRVLAYDVQLEALRLLVDRRAELSRARIQCVEPGAPAAVGTRSGQSKRDITTGQAKAILAKVKPRDVAGRDPPASRRRTDRRARRDREESKAVTKELKEMVLATGSTLMDLPGGDPSSPPALLPTRDVARFRPNRYASY